MLTADSETDKGEATHKLLNEKENTIQLLKNKLKIPATQLIQATKLTELKKEKEMLSQELNNHKAKVLNIIEEHSQWENEKCFLIANIDVLNENQLIWKEKSGVIMK